MKELTSLKNPVVQAARALDTAKERTRQGAFLCDGEHMAGEALSVCPDAGALSISAEKRSTQSLSTNKVRTRSGHTLRASPAICSPSQRNAP